MSIANLISSNLTTPNNVNTLLYCEGIRASGTVKGETILGVGESTFLDKVNIFGLTREYGDMIIDGTLTCGGFTGGTGTFNTINATNANLDYIECIGITGNTATFTGITSTTINTTSIIGTNCNMSGVVFGGSCIFSNGTFSGGITCGNNVTANGNITCGHTLTTLDLHVTNNLNCDNTITSQDMHATNNIDCDNNLTVIATASCNDLICYGNLTSGTYAQFNVSTTDSKLIVPRLDTVTRDSLGGEAGCLLENTDLTNLQTFRLGMWETINYYPQIMQRYLISDETLTNATLHKCGSVADLGEIINSNKDHQFVYSGFGDWRIDIAGIYKCNCTVAIKPNVNSFTDAKLYIYFGRNDESVMYDWSGFTLNTGSYTLPNEQKYQFECTTYLDPEKYSFFIYQSNDTTGDFTLSTSAAAPSAGDYNCQFTVQYISPKL